MGLTDTKTLFFFVVLEVLGIKLQALYMLGKWSVTELPSQQFVIISPCSRHSVWVFSY